MNGFWDTFGVAFFLTNFFYAFFVFYAYHRKQRLKTAELEYFGKLVNINLIASICVIFGGYTLTNLGDSNFFTQFFSRIYTVFLLIYNWYFAIYVVIISLNDEEINRYKKRINIISFIVFFINLILSLILPIELVNDERGIYSTGPAIYNLVIFGLVSCILGGYFMHHGLHKNHYKIRRYIPTIVSVAILIFMVAAQLTKLISIMETLVVTIMYFTVENPDIKIIEQLKIAKQEAEKANQNKSFFLSSMSHEIRTPLTAIVGFSEDIIDRKEETTEELYDKAKNILDLSNQVLDNVSNILDYNKYESSDISSIQVEYDFFKEFEKVIKTNIEMYSDNKHKINYYIFEDVPKRLVGDVIHIKEAFNMAIKYYVKSFNQDLMISIFSKENNGKQVIYFYLSDDFLLSLDQIKLNSKGKDYQDEEYNSLSRFIELYHGEIKMLDEGKILYSFVQKELK